MGGRPLAGNEIKEFVVRHNCAGMSLFHFLRRTLPRSMSRDVLGLIVDGCVAVNGKPADVQDVLRTSDWVTVTARPSAEKEAQPAAAALEILYRDEALICVDKPSGIPVIPDRRPKSETAVELCRRMLAGEGLYPRPVHRLDKNTSGVLMLALQQEFVQPLGELFAKRRIHKVYDAFVRGVPSPDSGSIDAPIGPDSRKASRMVVDRVNGKPAETMYRTAAAWQGYAHVEARPLTGRTHQVRVHLAHIKHPILCDALYGGGDVFHLSTIKPDFRIGRGRRERPLLNRQALHAREIEFESPATGRTVRVQSPLPQDLAILKQKLEKFAR